jgi:ABC-2 type transport system ATP-binding protein
VLLTTHYLDEAEHLADRVGVLANGRMVAEGTPTELMSAAPAATVSFDVPAGLDASELALPATAELTGVTIRFETETPTATLAPIISAAVAHDVELVNLNVRRPSLEDVFLQLGEAREGNTP